MNQIETRFGIITRQSIRRGTFSSVRVLIKQILDYIAHWSSNAEPFVWPATADEILAKVRLVQSNVKKPLDNNAKVKVADSRDTRACPANHGAWVR
jgi:hypothetical protein